MELKGVYTALITPFTDRQEVDYEGLRQNVAHQINAGVAGILPLGTTGETPTLSREEQDKIITTAVEEAKGKTAVLVGTGSNCTAHAIENSKRAQELGADGVLVVTPYYNKPTQEGIVRHFQAISENLEIPIVVYNIKGRTGVNIETATMKRLSELKNVIGVKEASGDIGQIGDVINIIQSRCETFSVISGDDAMTLPLIALGGTGIISVVSNLIPELIVQLVETALHGDFARARHLHYRLLPLFKAAFIETNPVPIKAAMSMCGMPSGPCRLPLCEMQAVNEEKLRKTLQDLEIL